MISESFKQDLLNRVDIVDVINSRVPLKKAGANWTACCPFHNEKTPSFTVSPSKQFYHCFGCGAHGNAVGFLMEYAGLGYVDAVRDLAESVGMKMPEFRSADRQKHNDGPDLYDIMQRAAQYYRDQLKVSERAIEYLKGRGLSGKVAARFGIGYAPAGWQNLENVFERYGDKALLECGLVIENEQGRRYDRFRDRIMFPILNQRGSVIGFGGRVFSDEEGPKYMNSPETSLFEKGRELYGLPQARQAVREQNRVLVVEGYMDVVALAQHGVENAVATLGTATTPVHVQKLMRIADEVVFCFDGDAAGRRAAWHALEVSLESLSDRKALKFLFLPTEHDPDSFVREHGAEAFQQRVLEAQPLSAFMLETLRKQADLSSIEGKSKLVAEAKGLLKRVAAPGLQLQLVKALAQIAGMEQIEVARLTDIRLAATYQRSAPKILPRSGGDSRLERELLRCLLSRPELASQVDIELPDLSRAEGRALVLLIEAFQEDAELSSALLSERFRDSEYEMLVNELQAESMKESATDEDLITVFEHTLAALTDRRRRARLQELETKIKAGEASREEKNEFGTLSAYRRSAELVGGAGVLT